MLEAGVKAPAFTVELRRANVGDPVTEPVRFAGTAIDLTGTPLSGASCTARGSCWRSFRWRYSRACSNCPFSPPPPRSRSAV